MLRYATALLWCAGILLAQSPNLTPAGQITISAYDFAGKPVPSWSGGSVVAVEEQIDPKERMPASGSAPLIHVFDSQGREATTVVLRIPNADRIWLRGTAHAADGLVAMTGSVKDLAGQAYGYVALASADGKVQNVFRTEPYNPSAVTFAPDGTLWTKGHDVAGPNRARAKTANGVIRHFDRSGKQLGDYVPQSSLTSPELFLGIDYLAASSNKVGWYLGRGSHYYFEISTDGRVEQYAVLPINETPGLESVDGLALTDSGDVFITRSTRGTNPQLFTLDRARQVWTPVPVPSTTGDRYPGNWLLGAQADTLVFRANNNAVRLFAVSHK